MPSYLVKEPLKHDGQGYAPGDSVEMDAKAARELLGLGVLGPVTKTKAKAEDKAADAGTPAEAEEGK
jgi:hypothetical protein